MREFKRRSVTAMLILRKRMIWRKSLAIAACALFVVGYYYVFLHPTGSTLFHQWSGKLYQASPLLKTSVDLINPVQEWEAALYAEFRSSRIDEESLSSQLSQHYGLSIEARDVDAWLARMAIYSNFLNFLGVWLYLPGPLWIREKTTLLTLSLIVVFLIWCVALGRVRRRVPFWAFTLVLVVALIIRVFILSTYSPYTTGSNYLVGRFVASGLPLYSKISWEYPPLYAYVLGATYLLTGGNFIAIESIPIVFSLVAMTFAYLVARAIDGPVSGLLVSLAFAVSPLFPWGLLALNDNLDVPCIAFVLASIYFILKYEVSSSPRYMILSGVLVSLSLLTKHLALFPVGLIFAYAVLQRGTRNALHFLIIPFVFSVLMVCSFLTPLFSWLTAVGATPSILPSFALPNGEKLGRFLLGPHPVDVLTFMGVLGCPYLAAKRKNGGILLFLIYLASTPLFLVLMPQIDIHPTVLIAPSVLIGAGVLLNDIGDNLPVQRLRKVLKLLFLVSILGAESTLVYSSTLNFMSGRQLDAQFVRECVKLIVLHSSPEDFVLAPPEAVAISGRSIPPEFARFPCIYTTLSELGQCLEAYDVRLLFIEIPGTQGFSSPKETDEAYIHEHYVLVGHVVRHMNGASPTHYDVLRRKR